VYELPDVEDHRRVVVEQLAYALPGVHVVPPRLVELRDGF
jgi:hypothetical protein